MCLCECVCYNKELMVKGNSRKENLFCLIIIVVICAVDFHKFSFQHFISADGVETTRGAQHEDADKRHLATLLSITSPPFALPPHSYHSHLRRSIFFQQIFFFIFFFFFSFWCGLRRTEKMVNYKALHKLTKNNRKLFILRQWCGVRGCKENRKEMRIRNYTIIN